MPKAVRIVTDPTLIAVGHLVRLLQHGDKDMKELAEGCGLSYLTVQRYCAAFYRAGAIHIAGWRKDGRGAVRIRIYQMGEGIDVPAPIVNKVEKARRLRVHRQDMKAALRRGERIDPRTLAAAVALKRS